jgi:hypothetical protein
MDIGPDDNLFDNAIYYAVFMTVLEEVEHIQDRKQYWCNALPGKAYIDELLNSNHPEHIHQVLHMQLDTFYALRDWLLSYTCLKGSKNIAVEEKLAIFLHLTTRPASNRDTQERFSHSGDTISQYIDSLFLINVVIMLIIIIVVSMRSLMPLWLCIPTL